MLPTGVLAPEHFRAASPPRGSFGGTDGLQGLRGARADQSCDYPLAWTDADHTDGRGDPLMNRIATLIGVGVLGVTFIVGWGTPGSAGQRQGTPVRQYSGQVQSIKIDRCGLEPGTCEGSIVLKLQDGREVALAIQPGTWIKRGDQLVLIDELAVGNYLRAQAMPLPATAPREGTVGSSPGERALTLEETARE
jgi:hypothetical protein